MSATCLPPICFVIAKRHGIRPERLRVADSIDALRVAALSHGISADEVRTYGPKTHALCIQADDIPGGDDVWIYLRLPLHPDIRHDTNSRLRSYQRGDLGRLHPEDDDERLISFLLLHEIAHHRLRHPSGGDKAKKEQEADLWALDRLKELPDLSSIRWGDPKGVNPLDAGRTGKSRRARMMPPPC
jgi:hypothetical protein